MEDILFNGWTVRQVLIGVGIGLAALIVLGVVLRMFRKSKSSVHVQVVHCNCGWQGQVSRIAGRCPRCGQTLGEQRARPTGRDN